MSTGAASATSYMVSFALGGLLPPPPLTSNRCPGMMTSPTVDHIFIYETKQKGTASAEPKRIRTTISSRTSLWRALEGVVDVEGVEGGSVFVGVGGISVSFSGGS